MCGRYTIRELRLLEAALDAIAKQDDVIPPYRLPNYNAAPGQLHPVAHLDEKGQRVIENMKWGFVPYWTKGKAEIAPVNAVAETASTKRMFRVSYTRRRCLIPADGFYEPKGPKTVRNRPWFFFEMKDKSPFAFGGIWETWHSPEGPANTFAILTTIPNEFVGQIHERQPVIIDRKDYARWLDPKTPANEVDEMVKAIDEDRLEAWPVSDAAKSPRGKGESLIEPIGPKING
jgi:putative SOS response-associated peptidase YedK